VAACYRQGVTDVEVKMTGCIVGWAHSKFGKHDGRDVESLIVEVAQGALADAGVSAADIDSVYLGTMNGGFVKQEFPASLVFQADPGFRFKPATRVENACATGSAAIHMGLNSLAAGKARFVLVVGVEKMTELNSAQAGEVLIKASYVAEEADIEAGFAGIFGKITSAYFQRYGDKSDALAKIAVKAHRNGAKNPYAHFQKEFAYEFCRNPSDKNPFVAGPLKRTDCSPVTDGAAAVILTDVQTALGMKQAIAFRAAQHVNDFLPMSKRDIIKFEGPQLAWKRALAEAKLDLLDLSFVESHDCFTSAELIEYEAMGLTAPGEGERAIHEGWVERDGKLPVNVSGGLKAKGHPVGATGVSMHVMSAMQLSGTAPGALQLPKAKIGGVFNMGGAAVANYVSIMEQLR
jgi:acetyl-CoA C-acetyltransferase